MFIKTFLGYHHDTAPKLFIANPLAEDYLKERKCSLETEKVVAEYGINNSNIVRILKEGGFQSPRDFVEIYDTLNEALSVKYEGHKPGKDGVEIFVNVNGHKYGYSKKEGGLDIADIARKFEKMLQFSAGKALSWLKRNTTLSSGSKEQEAKDAVKESEELSQPAVMSDPAPVAPAEGAPKEPKAEKSDDEKEEEEPKKEDKREVFFQNLKGIVSDIESILEHGESAVGSLMKNGKDWAFDKIAESRDNVREVSSFIDKELNKSEEPAE